MTTRSLPSHIHPAPVWTHAGNIVAQKANIISLKQSNDFTCILWKAIGSLEIRGINEHRIMMQNSVTVLIAAGHFWVAIHLSVLSQKDSASPK